jgi:hypothetical protein
VTEDDAKTKWCPFARVVEYDTVSATQARNRVARVTPQSEPAEVLADKLHGAACIADACMAWRWRHPRAGERGVGTGYCGLAGPP